MKILHIITGLNTGGAERMLEKLINVDQEGIQHVVISLLDKGTIGNALEINGTPVYEIGLTNSISTWKAVFSIWKYMINEKPDIIQAWMYHGNVAASFCKFIYRMKLPVVHNVRHSLYDLKHEKIITQLVIKINGLVSRDADALIYNSDISRIQHENYGFYKKRSFTIPNGFDTLKFVSNLDYKEIIRGELGIPQGAFVFLQLGRNHPMKGHQIFLKAAREIILNNYNVYFVIVGRGVDTDKKLCDYIQENDLKDRVLLLAERSDIEILWNAADIAVLSSLWGEGFPNVIGEAMACEKPAIVTDVGDAAHVVGDTGIIIPSDSVEYLSIAMNSFLIKSKSEIRMLGENARKRIVQNFDILKIHRDYINLYQDVLQNDY